MTLNDILNLIVDSIDTLLIPFVLFFLGQWYIRAKERSDSAVRDATQLESFLEHLSSENRERRKLALLALNHMRNAGQFPAALLQAIESIAALDDPEIAAAADLALGRTSAQAGLSSDERDLLFELLLPMKVHFERSHRAFQEWVRNPPAKPNIEIEDAIKASNSVVRNILASKRHLIPPDLQQDALDLIKHYDAWQEEYERLRPGGIRNPKVPYVFVGPKGFPFPVAAERNFMARFEKLSGQSGETKTDT
ncbi:MAG: hypothetical protein HY867_02895 [Chloroflexi bacterium]|nr:hypothetical protein [Chloroflexota bacterium]